MTDVGLARDGPIATVTLDRAERRNALDPSLLSSLAAAIEELARDDGVRVVVLAGSGPAFSAGADLEWMRASRDLDEDRNREDATMMAAAFETLDRCRPATIARVHGPAIGGGAGLVACTDVAVATDDARFAFAEVRLGLLPATIAPYVIRRIGSGRARELFTTGRTFGAAEAERYGLVHRVVGPESLDDAVREVARSFLAGAPAAIDANKRLVRDVTAGIDGPDLVERIADARAGEEGQEGISAFLEKRSPRWSSSDAS